MATYALIDKNGVLLQERAFSAFPAQPNPVKGFQWYALTEVTPSLTEAQKIGDYTLTVAAKSSSGSTITVSKSITGTVTGVDSSSGSTVFEIGATEVSMSDVTRLVA